MAENSMVVTAGIPEVTIGTGSLAGPTVPPTFSGKWSDMASDMASIAKEMGQNETPAQPATPQQAVVTPTPAPLQVVAPQAQTQPQTAPAAVTPPVVAPAPVEVPDKFRGSDGKLDQEKLLKSYAEAERTLKQAQNKLTQPAAQSPALPVNAPQQAVGNLTPLELQVARDLFNSGAGYSEAQAIAAARVNVRLMEAASGMATERAMGEVSLLREAQAEQRRTTELQSLAKNYPDVLTPKGFEELVKVREENPWINNSPEPWRAAAQILVGQKGMLQGQAGTVSIPNPMGAQPSNPLPVSPSSPVASNPIELNSPQQIDAYVKTLTTAQEAEFWKKAGYKWDVPSANFKGF